MSKFLGFQKRVLLQELGFTAAFKPPFSVFRSAMAEKGKDHRSYHVGGVKKSRILERDELHQVYCWLFSVDQEVVGLSPQKKERPELEGYELELLKAEYSDYVSTSLDGYINNIFKLANTLYKEADKGALVEYRELFSKVRIKKGGSRQATKRVLSNAGCFYGAAIVRQSAVLPTDKTYETVKTLLEEVIPQIFMVSANPDHWQGLDILYMRVKPCLSNFGEFGNDFKAMRYLSELHGELNRITVSKVTKAGKRILRLEGLPSFQDWLDSQFPS